jgi:hypothetical protein
MRPAIKPGICQLDQRLMMGWTVQPIICPIILAAVALKRFSIDRQ